MSKEAIKLAQKWQQTDWNTESPMSAGFAVSGADYVINALMDALQAALAEQPANNPPPWWPAVENILKEYGLQAIDFVADFKKAQKEWVNLSDDEISEIAINTPPMVHELARAVEAKIKEKNE